MQTRAFTALIGLFYIAFGVLAFIPVLYTSPHATPPVDLTASYGNFLGVFPTNALTDAARIFIGFVGLIAARRVSTAETYCRFLFLFMGLLTFASFILTLQTFWGYAPVYWNDAWLSGATSLLAGYFGYVAPESTNVEPAPGYSLSH